MRGKAERYLLFLIIGLSLIGLLIKILSLWKFSTAFTYDQGRDLLDLREMVVLKKLRLIGPTTSLHGVFFGPFWYWLALPFYLVSGGHPVSTIYPLLAMGFLTPLFIYQLLNDKKLAFFLGALFIFSFPAFQHSLVALNPHFLVFITPLILILFAKFLLNQKPRFLFWAAFLAGAALHFQVVLAILWLVVFFFSAFIFKKLKILFHYKASLIGYLISLLPQILFEVRHDFLQTKVIVRSFFERGENFLVFPIFNRIKIFADVFWRIGGESFVLAGVLVILVVFLIFNFRKQRKIKERNEVFYLTSIAFIFLLTIFIWFIFYPFAIKSWDVVDIEVLITMLIGLALYSLFRKGGRDAVLSLFFLFLICFLGVRPFHFLLSERIVSLDPANLRKRLEVVDLIYEDAKGRGINIFTFAPYVYDYPYQYLIWWRAKTKYHYLPEQYVYLPNQPAYVPAKEKADSLIEKKRAECDYLIIEPFESQEKWFREWRGNFSMAKKVWEIGRTRIEKLCQ